MSAHPHRLFSSRTRTCLTPPITGTDAPMRLSGSRRLASRWFGSARGLRREESGTCTGAPVPVVALFLLCLLSDASRSEGLGISSPLLGCHFWRSCFRIVRFACFCSGHSSCVSLRFSFGTISHIFGVTMESWRLLLENVLYSAQCLVRQWIQYLRQSTELVNYREVALLRRANLHRFEPQSFLRCCFSLQFGAFFGMSKKVYFVKNAFVFLS